MQIVALEIDNLKRIRTVLIVPKGPLVQITGANGSGKSSVLDGIYWAIAGKKAIDAATPVRQGEETARVKLDLGEVVVTRKF
jgi:DNA repair exonuclease SbcCD ATPase subunit